MMPKLTLKLTKHRPQNEPRTRQFPDKIPTPLRDAKREPKWIQNGAKSVLKGSQNPTKIDKKGMKIMQKTIEAAQSRARTPRVAERRPKRPRKAARSLPETRKEAERRGNTPREAVQRRRTSPKDAKRRRETRKHAERHGKTPRDMKKTLRHAETRRETRKDAERRGKTRQDVEGRR